MFDLFGFWVSVTVLSWFILVPVVALCILIFSIALFMAIPSDAAGKISSWIFKDDGIMATFVGGRIRIHYGFIAPGFFSLFFWLFMGMQVFRNSLHDLESKYTIVEMISNASTFLAPIFGYLGIILGLFFSVVLLLKYGYRASIFAGKVNNHMTDKSKHK